MLAFFYFYIKFQKLRFLKFNFKTGLKFSFKRELIVKEHLQFGISD